MLVNVGNWGEKTDLKWGFSEVTLKDIIIKAGRRRRRDPCIEWCALQTGQRLGDGEGCC